MANTFTSLILCKHCGYKYRHIKERGKSKYLCQGYAKKIGCTERNVIEEKILLDIIQIFCNRNKIELLENNKFMKSIVKIINIDNENNITIEYKNGEKGLFKNSSINI